MSKSKKKYTKSNYEFDESSHHSRKVKQSYSKKRFKDLDRALKAKDYDRAINYQDTI